MQLLAGPGQASVMEHYFYTESDPSTRDAPASVYEHEALKRLRSVD